MFSLFFSLSLSSPTKPVVTLVLLCPTVSGVWRKMVEFGDDWLIDSYRIPWLIWIQFLVMFLLTLVIFLSYFGFLALDAEDCIISSSNSRLDPHFACYQRAQVSTDHDSSDTSTTSSAREAENISDREGSSPKDLGPAAGSRCFIHPCRYFDIAKQAFLKCLGLGSTSRKSCSRRRGHEDWCTSVSLPPSPIISIITCRSTIRLLWEQSDDIQKCYILKWNDENAWYAVNGIVSRMLTFYGWSKKLQQPTMTLTGDDSKAWRIQHLCWCKLGVSFSGSGQFILFIWPDPVVPVLQFHSNE